MFLKLSLWITYEWVCKYYFCLGNCFINTPYQRIKSNSSD